MNETDILARTLRHPILFGMIACWSACSDSAPPTSYAPMGIPFAEQVSLRERCVEKQQNEMAACAALSGPDRKDCELITGALLVTCDDLPAEWGESWTCEGDCRTYLCAPDSPCELGKDLDGDGDFDNCVAGERCAPASEGTVCHEGLLFDCHCTTYFYPRGGSRRQSECACVCN